MNDQRTLRFDVFTVLDGYPAPGQRPPDTIARTLSEAELADQLGFDTFWLAEHHFAPYGICPSPPVLLSAIASTRVTFGSDLQSASCRSSIRFGWQSSTPWSTSSAEDDSKWLLAPGTSTTSLPASALTPRHGESGSTKGSIFSWLFGRVNLSRIRDVGCSWTA